jgi:hypothetical protein
MEQASIQLPGALAEPAETLIKPAPPEQTTLSLRESIKLAASQLSVIALCGAAAIGGILSGHESSAYRASVPAPKVGGPNYKPIAGIEAGDAASTYRKTGHAIDVVGADKAAQEAFASYYHGDKKDMPSIMEMVRVQDKEVFAPELKHAPNVYPFIAYNATRVPVDVRFLDYALEGTRSWLDEVAEHGGTVTMEDHTQFSISSRTRQHRMILTDTMPAFLPVARYMGTDGYTTWDMHNPPVRSFVLPESSAEVPFRELAIATEICQSMVKVDGAVTLPGGSLQQNALERFVAYVNPRNRPALHDAELAGQESICNGLGRVIAAGYQGGAGAFDSLPEQVGRTGSILREPWIDFSMYANVVPELLKLRHEVAGGDQTMIIADENAPLPTVEYYRQQ